MSSKRILWLLAAGALVALLLWRRVAEPAASAPAPAPVVVRPETRPVVAAPGVVPVEAPAATAPAVVEAPGQAVTVAPEPPRPLPPGVVSIRDQKTIDFSTGKPVVRDDAAEKAAIEAALKEMEEATRGVTFGPNSGPAMAP
jgi:hypothetical protein